LLPSFPICLSKLSTGRIGRESSGWLKKIGGIIERIGKKMINEGILERQGDKSTLVLAG
jgi:hypothetical protein